MPVTMTDFDPYFETQYNNRAAVPDHADFIQSWIDRSASFRGRAANAHLKIAYGDTDRAVMDIFPCSSPDRQLKSPVHIFIHGGYWQAMSKDSFSFIAEHFNAAGECAVILNYDLCPQVSLSQISQQIFQAALWILEHIDQYGGDPERVQVSGHSAGGHLLASLLTRDWSAYGFSQPPFCQMNALSGLFDLRPLLNTSTNVGLRLDQQTALDNSPLHSQLQHSSNELKLRLFVGELESDEYKKQSQELLNHWQRHFNVSYQLLSQAHHFSILDAFLQQEYPPIQSI